MNLIECLYVYVNFIICNVNFILFLIVTIVINDFRFYQLFNAFFTVSNKYFDNDFSNVKSKY